MLLEIRLKSSFKADTAAHQESRPTLRVSGDKERSSGCADLSKPRECQRYFAACGYDTTGTDSALSDQRLPLLLQACELFFLRCDQIVAAILVLRARPGSLLLDEIA